MVTCLRILIFTPLLFGASMQLAGEGSDGELQDGLAVVTTSAGEVMLTEPGGSRRELELHAVESLTGTELSSGKGAYAFLSLSNGSALGIYENSSLRFVRYRQLPFLPERESLYYEASRSELIIEVRQGSLSFSAEQLSPLSTVIIKLPSGRIEAHKASGRVCHDERGSWITITSGIVGYDYPGAGEEEFINAPNMVRIDNQSGKPGPIVASTVKSDPAHKQTQRLVKATHHSRERVVFKLESEEAAIPQPILVAKPETLLEPTPRPYTYRD